MDSITRSNWALSRKLAGSSNNKVWGTFRSPFGRFGR